MPGDTKVIQLIMNEINRSIGQKIKQKRKELGVTQYELGRLLGCKQQHIQNYEVGYCAMPIEMLCDLANLCLVPIDWFILDDD